jgi:hypothetical protein
MEDKKLLRWLLVLMLLPLALAYFSGDRFRYPCQDPENWDKQICKLPTCDVTRTCPQHIFKGQRDPRLGPPTDEPTQTIIQPATQSCKPATAQGENCGK